MKITYQITNAELFNSKIVHIDIERFTEELNIEIELTSGTRIEIQGKFGKNDFEHEYGFVLVNEREVIGDYLSKIRKGKNISKYRITHEIGLSKNIIDSIERGSASYTIDSFLTYTQAIGVCLFFDYKSNKKNSDNPLDEEDMLEMRKNNPLEHLKF